jgi:imidazolonepropionase-like amidohydrolase
MTARRWTWALALAALAAATGAAAEPPPQHGARPASTRVPAPAQVVAIVHGAVHTGTGEVIDDGTVVLEGGRVRAVGRALAPPPGARVVEARGAIVTPGLSDPLTSIGLVEVELERATRDDDQGGADRVRAGFRASDGYDPASTVIPIARAEGLTSVGVVPRGGLFPGQSAWAHLDGDTAAEAIVAAPVALHVALGAPADAAAGGRATAILRVREAFEDARAFARSRGAYERNQARRFAASRLDLEALGRALGGGLPVVFHVDRAADILAALAVAKEHGLRPVIAGGAEAWKVAPALARAKVPVVVQPLVAGPVSFDALGARPDNAARLHAAGVLVAITTGETHAARKLRQAAGNAVRAGLPHEAAIAAVTRAPAEALGLGDRLGTIAPGRVADVVVWSGDPLELGTRATHVFVRGREVELRTRQTALLERWR